MFKLNHNIIQIMNHNIEWTTTNRGARAITFQQQKYR